jgi:signal transduction histidine kinase
VAPRMWQRWFVVRDRPWLTPIGLAVIALVVTANAAGAVGFGLSGDALVVTLGVVVYVAAALLFLFWTAAPPAVVVCLLLMMATAAALTHHGDPTGTGGIGLYLGMAFAPLRVDVDTAAITSIVGVLIFDLQLALEAPNRVVFILVVDGGAAFFFLLGMLLRREREQRDQVALLLARLEASREMEKRSAMLAERTRLARETHDVLAHTLSGLVLQLDGARLLSATRGSDQDVTHAIERAHRLARTGLQEARQAITALRGEQTPGPEQLPALVNEHRLATGRDARLKVSGTERALPADARLAVYRTAQEALSNVRKHARDADVRLHLAWGDGDVRLVVEDTGATACSQAGARAPGSGYGLTGMAERAELLGGRLDITTTPAGFRIELALPAPPVTAETSA